MKRAILSLVLVVTGLSLLSGSAAAQALKAGAATSNITPRLGSNIVGGFKPYPATHVHDQLHARCLVLDDGQTRLALVVCDLLGIHRAVSDEARKLIQESIGLPPQQVQISSTHTHSACSALGDSRYQPEQSLNEYQRFVARRIADGVRWAVNNLRPAEMAFGTADSAGTRVQSPLVHEAGHGPDESVRRSGYGEDESAGGERESDRTRRSDRSRRFVFLLREAGGKPIAVSSALFSLHYVGGVGGGHVSADYFAMFCQELTRLMHADRQDPPFVAMLSNGTSGDINNINFREPRHGKPSYEQMKSVAHDVAPRCTPRWQAEIHIAGPAGCPLSRVGHSVASSDRRTIAMGEETLAKAPKTEGKVDLSAIYAERMQHLAESSRNVRRPRCRYCASATLPRQHA